MPEVNTSYQVSTYVFVFLFKLRLGNERKKKRKRSRVCACIHPPVCASVRVCTNMNNIRSRFHFPEHLNPLNTECSYPQNTSLTIAHSRYLHKVHTPCYTVGLRVSRSQTLHQPISTLLTGPGRPLFVHLPHKIRSARGASSPHRLGFDHVHRSVVSATIMRL